MSELSIHDKNTDYLNHHPDAEQDKDRAEVMAHAANTHESNAINVRNRLETMYKPDLDDETLQGESRKQLEGIVASHVAEIERSKRVAGEQSELWGAHHDAFHKEK